MNSKIHHAQNINFNGFAKFKSKSKNIDKIKGKIIEKCPDSTVFSDKGLHGKKWYYILTGKHYDKFFDLFGQVEIFDLKVNIEKYMGKKAKKIDVHKLEKMLKKDKFKI